MTKRRIRRPRRRARLAKVTTRNSTCSIESFLSETRPDPAVERALRAALPGRVVPGPSHWLAPGVARARKASGLSASEVLDGLEQLVTWVYARLPEAQADLAAHLLQIELHRRAQGEPARTIELPPPPDGSLIDDGDLLAALTQWEATSYAGGLFTPRDHPLGGLTTMMVVQHLARVDGLPVRFDRLDPVAFIEELQDGPPVVGGGVTRPDGFEAPLLAQVALLYARLAKRGALDPSIAIGIAEQVYALAVLYDGGEVAVA